MLVWAATLVLGLMTLGILLNVLTAPRLESAPAPRARPRVSLLIPARDEEANLDILMPLLDKLDYPDLEILILDDQSGDGTAAKARAGKKARLVSGEALPEGWLGKNWACRQLAREARGDILVFCDADVRPGPESIMRTVGLMEKLALDALTCIPRQILGTWAEKAVMPPLLFLPVLGFLPLALVHRLRWPLVSVGVGQWFALSRTAYDRCGGHAAVRAEIVEDMMLARKVKGAGLKLGVAVSRSQLATRMYTGLASLWRGFSKNMYFLTGAGWVQPPLVMGLFLLWSALPWIMPLAGRTAWLVPLGLLCLNRWLTAWYLREPPDAWLWHPLGSLLVPAVAARSWWGYRRRSLQWKGRVLEAGFAAPAAPGPSGPKE